MPKSTNDKATFNVVSVVLGLLFILALFLLYKLHLEHTGVQTKQAEQITQVQSFLGQTEKKLESSIATETELRANIEALTQQHQGEVQTWEGKLGAATQTIQTLEHDAEVLKQQSATAIASEREQAAQALADANSRHQQEMEQAAQTYAQLDDQFNAANVKIVELDSAIASLHGIIEEGKAQRAADAQAFEGRIENYRVMLEGEYPERAAQLIGIEQQAQAAAQELRAAQAQFQAVENDLIGQLSAASQVIEEKNGELAQAATLIEEKTQALAMAASINDVNTQALAQAAASIEEKNLLLAEATAAIEQNTQDLALAAATIEDTQGQLAQTQAELATTIQQSNDTIAGLQAEHAAEASALNEVITNTKAELSDTRTKLQETTAAAEATQTDMQGQIDTLSNDFATYKTEATALVASMKAAHTDQVNELSGKLGMTEEQLAATRAELGQTITQAEANETQRQAEIAALQNDLATEKADNKLVIESMWQTRAAIESDLEGKLHSLQQQQQKTSQLHKTYAELSGHYTDRGMLLTLAESDLQFAGGQAELTTAEPESLVRIANILSANADLRILLEGHTDSAGSETLNQALSEKRADAVKQVLVGQGIDESRIDTAGIGESRPIASNQTYDGRRKNRRVEIYITE